MSDSERTGVTVTRPYGPGDTRDDHYPRGTQVSVTDGHLFIHGDNVTSPVAVYAPGKWLWVEVHQ